MKKNGDLEIKDMKGVVVKHDFERMKTLPSKIKKCKTKKALFKTIKGIPSRDIFENYDAITAFNNQAEKLKLSPLVYRDWFLWFDTLER